MGISCIFFAEQHEQTAVAAMDPLHTLHGATRLLPNFFFGYFMCMVLIFLGKGGFHFRLQARRVVTLECWGPVCVSLFFSPFHSFYMHVYSNETSCMSRFSE